MARMARKTGLELGLHIAGLAWTHPTTARLRGGLIAAAGVAFAVALVTYHAADPSLNAASALPPLNALGGPGATAADAGMQSLGLAAGVAALLMVLFGLYRAASPHPDRTRGQVRLRAFVGALGVLALAGLLSAPAPPAAWPLAKGLGGFWGDGLLHGLASVFAYAHLPLGTVISPGLLAAAAATGLGYAIGVRRDEGAAAPLCTRQTLRTSPPPPPPPRPNPSPPPPWRTPSPRRSPRRPPAPWPRRSPSRPPRPAPRTPAANSARPRAPSSSSSPAASPCRNWPCWPSPSRGPRPSTKAPCARTPSSWRACWPSSACAAISTRSAPAPWSRSMSWCRPPA